jgi:hypothetical protein
MYTQYTHVGTQSLQLFARYYWSYDAGLGKHAKTGVMSKRVAWCVIWHNTAEPPCSQNACEADADPLGHTISHAGRQLMRTSGARP